MAKTTRAAQNQPLPLFERGRIHVVPEPISWRWGIPGLTAAAELMLGHPLTEEESGWVIFMNSRRTSVRILHWEDDCVLLIERRLTAGNHYPRLVDKMNSGEPVVISRGVLKVLFAAGCGAVPVQAIDVSSRDDSGS